MTITEELGLAGEYALAWDNFIGQEHAKEELLIACQAAKERGERLPHILLASGSPGVGKTNLAILLAQEMGVQAKVVSGKLRPIEAMAAIIDMQDRDILVYEECHLAVAGGKTQAESWMLHMMENGTIISPIGPQDMPNITIVGTTTEPGRFPKPLLDRFEITPNLVPYTTEETARIGEVMAADKNLTVPWEILLQIATAMNRNPRNIRKFLNRMRDIVQVKGCDIEEGYKTARSLMGVTEDGLTRTAVRYLILLRRLGSTAGERSLIETLGEPGGLAEVEQVLIEKGYIIKTRGGRQLMADGMRRANDLAKEEK